MKVNVTTCMDEEQWKLCKTNGWTWAYVFRVGIGTLLKPEAQTERLLALENELKAIKSQGYYKRRRQSEFYSKLE
jgi:hypothetical protein